MNTLAVGVKHNPFSTAKLKPEIAALVEILNSRKPLPIPAQHARVAQETLDVSDLFGSTAMKAMEEPSIAPKRKYAREVSDHLKINTLPKDFNSFLTDLLPNLRVYAGAFIYTKQIDVDEVINSFVVYMLEISPTHEKVRWQLFDPEAYPDMPYWKWLAAQLRFFCMSKGKKVNKENATHRSISEVSEDYDETTRGMISLDEVSFESASSEESIDYVFATEILKKVYDVSERAIKKAPKAVRFENYAYTLMELRLQGYSSQEISERFFISKQGVSQWMTRLRVLIGDLIGEPVGHLQAF